MRRWIRPRILPPDEVDAWRKEIERLRLLYTYIAERSMFPIADKVADIDKRQTFHSTAMLSLQQRMNSIEATMADLGHPITRMD